MLPKHLKLNNGNRIPTLGLGTWNAPKDIVGNAVNCALTKSGYQHIDCASIYGNEKEIGTAFHDVFSGKAKREEVFITSKLWNTDHHPNNVEKACRKTLADLQLEYLDLYLIHWGVAFIPGGDLEPLDKDKKVITEPVSTQETWGAMEALVKKGLVKSIGVANFTTMMLVDLLTYAKIAPAVNQIELHPYNAQHDLVAFCQHRGITVTAYSPLGTPGGIKAGEPVLLKDPAVIKIARAHKKSPAQVLLNWAISRKTIPIPKSTSHDRILENMQVYDFELTKHETDQLNKLNKNYRFVHPIGWWGLPYFS